MSLRLKLALLLFAIVGTTVLASWWFTGRAVLQPFAREVMATYLDEVVYVADRIEKGANPKELGRELKLDIDVHQEAPPRIRRLLEDSRGRCEEEQRGRFKLTYCRGRRAPTVLQTSEGLLVVKRELDPGAPSRRVGEVLALIAFVLLLVSALVAYLVTRPLKTATEALEHIARGDLSHRLPVTGGRELGEVARAYNAMVDRVEVLLRTERELMAGISHELRTPLARLRVELEILRDHALPEKRLVAMEKDVEEIDRLIGDLLESSRLTLGDRKLASDRVDLGDIVKEAIERTPMPEHKVAVDAQATTPVLGDRAYLVRVVCNLLENARKYAPPATEVNVTIRGGSLEVADRGPGVDPEELAHIFEPFYRGSRARSQANKSGLGLGLMLARRVVTILGGTIRAENRQGGGLAIRFELPITS
jgi:two-component system, OmpR family, sensor kinase